MILDLNKFIQNGRSAWSELEAVLDTFETDPYQKLDLESLERFHYLYRRASADLARLADLSARQDIRIYLESIVSRSFALIHAAPRDKRIRLRPFYWFFNTFPNTFRRHLISFWVALAIFAAGMSFGGGVIVSDPDAKPALMPFAHLMQDPAKRVAWEETVQKDRMAGKKSSFASYLISNNTRVAFLALSLGITWGAGTFLVVLFNGIYLGATVADYIQAGQSEFLTAWLLPHGSIEIPAIVLAAQAGFILAGALLGIGARGRPVTFGLRIRRVSKDLLTLMGGVCLMLIWAGFIEAFLSQYHEPFVTYQSKILFGTVQLCALVLFLLFSGKKRTRPE